MSTEVIIPKGSPIKMKVATLLDAKGAHVISNYSITPVASIRNRSKIYQFFVEVNKIIPGSRVNYGRRPVRVATVIHIDEQPESDNQTRWSTIDFGIDDQKTVKFDSITLNEPTYIPVHFDHYPGCWGIYSKRNRMEQLPRELVGAYYSTREIDGILYAVDPVYPEKESDEEILIQMDPVNKQRLLEQLKRERDRIDKEIEILERKKP